MGPHILDSSPLDTYLSPCKTEFAKSIKIIDFRGDDDYAPPWNKLFWKYLGIIRVKGSLNYGFIKGHHHQLYVLVIFLCFVFFMHGLLIYLLDHDWWYILCSSPFDFDGGIEYPTSCNTYDRFSYLFVKGFLSGYDCSNVWYTFGPSKPTSIHQILKSWK